MATGGYECEFVHPVPECLSCPVCLLPFRDPHLVSCCGNKFCAPCLGQIRSARRRCPVCKQQFMSMLDRGYQRKVLNLRVTCSKKNDGCQWAGELRHLDHHEREECEWAVVECSYQCGADLPRRLMDEHERAVCPRRPINLKLGEVVKSMEEKMSAERKRHESEMTAMKKEFRLTLKKEVTRLEQLFHTKLAETKREIESKMTEEKKERKVTVPTRRSVRPIFNWWEMHGNSSKQEFSSDDEEAEDTSSKPSAAKRHKGEKNVTTPRIAVEYSNDEIILDVSKVHFGTLETTAIAVQIERDGVVLSLDYNDKSMTLKMFFSDVRAWKMSLEPSSCAIVVLLSPVSSRGLNSRIKARFCIADNFLDSGPDSRVDKKHIVLHLNRSPDQQGVAKLLKILKDCHESFTYQLQGSTSMKPLLESLKPTSSPKRVTSIMKNTVASSK